MNTPLLDGIRKESSISFNALKNIAKGHKPLFHMVNKKNVTGFLRSQRIMSPAEAKLRGLLKNIEGGAGIKRFPVTGKTVSAVHVAGGKAKINLKDVIKGIRSNYDSAKWTKSHPIMVADEYAMAGLPGVTGSTRRQKLLNWLRPSDAGKNWSSISMSPGKPNRTYGDIGIMTGAKDIKYPLELLTPKAPFYNPSQYFVGGKPSIKKGLLSSIELPTIKGTITYDPKYVMESFGIETAKKLKTQGAIPMNARFFRKLKALNKQLPTYVPSNAKGVELPYHRLVEKYPDFETTILPKAKEYVNTVLGI